MLAIPLAALAAPAEDDEAELASLYGDKASISIATGSLQPLRRAPAVASVITAEDIAAMGATDLDQVLESVPGLHVMRASSFYKPLYVVRGVFTGTTVDTQVLMLQNGLPVTVAYTGEKGNSWGGLPLENVARVEVIRGPGSALYGAEAYGGVINVITKSAAEARGTELGLRGGSFDTQDAWIQHGGALGPLAVAAYLRAGHTGGPHPTVAADAQTRLDRLTGTHASLAPGPVQAQARAVDGSLELSHERWRWHAIYRQRRELGTGTGVSSALDPVGRGSNERISSDLSWTEPVLTRDWGAGATLSYFKVSERSTLQLFPPGVRFPTGTFPDGVLGGPGRWQRDSRLTGYLSYAGFARHRLRIGAGHADVKLYRTETWKNYRLNPAGVPVPTGPVIDYTPIQPHILPQHRRIDHVYLQDEWSLARDWTLTAGWRHDVYSDVGHTSNPRLALVWDAALDLTAKILYGRAFRAPAFSELYGVNPVSNANPQLKPERISTLEAAVSWQARPALQLNLNVFRYAMNDLISSVPNPAPAPGGTYQNVGRQHGFGGEVELVWDARRNLRLSGYLARQRSTNDATGADAGYAPRLHAWLRADWRPAGDWQAGAQANRVAGRHRTAGDTRPPGPDYTTVDLHLRRTLRAGWTLQAGVTNLFNADAREPSLAPGLVPQDLPLPPRGLRAELRYRF